MKIQSGLIGAVIGIAVLQTLTTEAVAQPVPETSDAPAVTTATMRAIATRICSGDQTAFTTLEATADELYRNIDLGTEKKRTLSNFTLLRAAFTVLGDEAAKGNQHAFRAIKLSLGKQHLRSFAPQALGTVAAAGNGEALDMLLHHDKWGILLSSAVFAIQAPAEKNNEKAVDFLLRVMDDPAHRALWNAASRGLITAAVSGNPRAVAALDKYEQSKQK